MQDGPTAAAARERVHAELVDAEAPGGTVPGGDDTTDPTTDPTTGPNAPGDGGTGETGDGSEQISSPTKLIRIASMVRTMLDEVRRAPLDDAGRRRLAEIHGRSLEELESILSPDLRQELGEVILPLTSNAPTESELRLAQAQLVGWLEGLFHGIQATLFTQQAAAQGQLDQMRRRALEQAPTATGPSGYL